MPRRTMQPTFSDHPRIPVREEWVCAGFEGVSTNAGTGGSAACQPAQTKRAASQKELGRKGLRAFGYTAVLAVGLLLGTAFPVMANLDGTSANRDQTPAHAACQPIPTATSDSWSPPPQRILPGGGPY